MCIRDRLSSVIAPQIKATDSLWFILLMTFIINAAWFFGIHNATFWGLMGPIMMMNISENAAQLAAGIAVSYTHLENNQRRLISSELLENAGYYQIDFEDVEEKCKEARILLLCNPHNPCLLYTSRCV